MKRFLEMLTGYVVVIGVIVAVTSLILYVQNRPKGRYAELIKDGVLYEVKNVLDGDTLVASVQGREVTVRLIGIDTPEVVDPRRPIECYGPEASARAKELLLKQRVYLEKEEAKGDYDMYGRVLAYAKLPDGNVYNEQMIRDGYAREYTFNKEKYKYQKLFKEAQAGAKKEKRGLWLLCPQK